MGFLSKALGNEPKSPVDDDVSQVRARARRRLIGAAVLLAVGVIGFPLLFETQPRPVPVDVPIVVPNKDKAPVLAPPAKITDRSAAAAVAAASVAAAATSKDASAPSVPVITERATEAGRDVTKAVATAATAAATAASAASAAAGPVVPAVAPAADKARDEQARREQDVRDRAARAAEDAKAKAAAARAKATADAKATAQAKAAADAKATPKRADGAKAKEASAAASGAGKFAVQIGAYTIDDSVRDVRGKLERVGLKSYTQVVKGSNGVSSTRVRAGPYDTRQEAERAAERARSIGMAPTIVPL